MMEYQEFLERKRITVTDTGFDIDRGNINPILFGFQKDIVKWAIAKGRAALFTMTGTGKTLMQLEWAKHIHNHTRENVLVVAPLAVSHQTAREGLKLGINAAVCRKQGDIKSGINITNYEMINHFDLSLFSGVVLDESSILKSYSGSIRNMIIEGFSRTPYRLACTATPAPNDYMELGNHSEFLASMTRTEMLSMFFVHDGGETSKWRLKGHAEDKYWEWVASWSVVLTKPSDLGYEDNGFNLPPLNINEVVIERSLPMDGFLFPMVAETLMERRQARRDSKSERVEKCAEIANSHNRPFLAWCDLNSESEMLTKRINGAVEVKGSDSNEHKENAMLGFSDGSIRCLVTKPSIAGHGMNWQHCSDMAFVGLSDSFEQYFQAIRRCWRFGQTKPVNAYIITSDMEGNVVSNIKRKEEQAMKMINEMVVHTKNIVKENIKSTKQETTSYKPVERMEIPSWM
jgi:hypothetical protein